MPSSARFVVGLAWRETRGAGRHFASLVACITLGVGALVAVGSFAAGLERTVGRSARALGGGGGDVGAAHPPAAAAPASVSELTREGAHTLSVSELVAMSSAAGKSQIVELKAAGSGYPLYGNLVTDPATPEPLIGSGR